MVDHVSISLDGCRVVFVHDPYDTMYGKDQLNRITVKAINLCQEDRHARQHESQRVKRACTRCMRYVVFYEWESSFRGKPACTA